MATAIRRGYLSAKISSSAHNNSLTGFLGRNAVLLAACSVSLLAWGGNVINVKPELSEDGYYEIGYTPTKDDAKSVITAANYPTYFGYVDWTALGFQTGDKVRLTGNVLLTSLPTDLEYDWSSSSLKKIVFASNTVVPTGSTFTVPSGVEFCYNQGTVTVSGDTYSFSLTAANKFKPIPCDFVVNGTVRCSSTRDTVYSGRVSGTGTFQISSYWYFISFTGELTGSLKFDIGNTQKNCGFKIQTTNESPTIASFTPYYYNGDGGYQYLEFNPNRSEPTTLTIGEVSASSTGDQMKVAAGHAIKVTTHNSNNFTLLRLGAGSALFHFGKFGSSANNSTLRVNNDLNLTVDDFHYNRPHKVSYAGFTEALNTSTLDFSKSTSYASVAITGKNPATLPRQIKCAASKTSAVTVSVTESEWTFPIDFGAESADEVNPNRCEGMGMLSVPETGTITVTNAMALAGSAGPTRWTEYPLMTCTSGGEAFENWTVNFTGDWSKYSYRTEVRSTGLYLLAKRPLGLILLLK